MDHAGIATQAKVEERLRGEHFRYDLGREKFLDKRSGEWKDEYATTIRNNGSKMGLSGRLLSQAFHS